MCCEYHECFKRNAFCVLFLLFFKLTKPLYLCQTPMESAGTTIRTSTQTALATRV